MAGSYSVDEHFDRFVKAQVASECYNNESEAVRDALRRDVAHSIGRVPLWVSFR